MSDQDMYAENRPLRRVPWRLGIGAVLLRSSWSETTRWNIFARELEKVLASRGLRLGHLDDRRVVEHPEKVRRLQLSLDTPKHFPVLNPAEMDRLFVTMQLTRKEQCCLRAALLATAVERVLMDRLEPDTALMAANDVYEICLAVIRGSPERMLAVRSGTPHESGSTQNTQGAQDALVAAALDLIDEATLALHAARDSLTTQAQLEHARAAESAFARALALLRGIKPPADLRPDWEAYVAEAREGQASAEAVLRSEVR